MVAKFEFSVEECSLVSSDVGVTYVAVEVGCMSCVRGALVDEGVMSEESAGSVGMVSECSCAMRCFESVREGLLRIAESTSFKTVVVSVFVLVDVAAHSGSDLVSLFTFALDLVSDRSSEYRGADAFVDGSVSLCVLPVVAAVVVWWYSLSACFSYDVGVSEMPFVATSLEASLRHVAGEDGRLSSKLGFVLCADEGCTGENSLVSGIAL